MPQAGARGSPASRKRPGIQLRVVLALTLLRVARGDAALLVVAKIAHRLPDQHDNARESHENEHRPSPRRRGIVDRHRKGKKLGHVGRLLVIEQC